MKKAILAVFLVLALAVMTVFYAAAVAAVSAEENIIPRACGTKCGLFTCKFTETCRYVLGIIPVRCVYNQACPAVTPTSTLTKTPTPITSTSTTVQSTALSDVKVSVVYERLNDNRPKRTIDEQLQIFKETYTDMIFRASWRWNPLPKSCSDVPSAQKQACMDSGYSFEDMKNTVSAIKKQNPNIIIIGAIPAQKLNKNEVNEITGETFTQTQTWAMALDPAKWGITSPTKTEIQNQFAALLAGNYYPDITNPTVQDLILSWAKNQIDYGSDGIWIDLLYTQAAILKRLTGGNETHPAVRDSFMAASDLIDKIHEYGNSKGKYIYVGTWDQPGGEMGRVFNRTPPIDFATSTPSVQEVNNGNLNEAEWDVKIANLNQAYGDIPFFSFIDWADEGSQTSAFSKLSKEDQSSFLVTADDFFKRKNIAFVYPVHGGLASSTVLIYGKYSSWYDSLAPEFQTYDTIKELAREKAGPVVPTPTVTPTVTPSLKTWIYDGPIYETQPYYYPGHSFKEITEQVPSLADLGIKTIYLMPFWEQPPGKDSPLYIYHTFDYTRINPVYGTEQDLRDLISAAHVNGIKVLFDLVTCCTWEGSYLWNNDATISISLTELDTKANSLGWKLKYDTKDGKQYVTYNCTVITSFNVCDVAGMIVGGTTVKLMHYPHTGWGYAVDKINPVAIEYFTNVSQYYVKEYGIDGWRLDAPNNNWNTLLISGDHSGVEMLRSAKNAIEKISPSAIFLSESSKIDRESGPILDEVAEISYNYELIDSFGKLKTSQQLVDFLKAEVVWYDRTRARFAETHDTNRVNSGTSATVDKPLFVIISTIPGVPMIQAGQEIGAANSFWANPTVDWTNGNNELKDFYKKVFKIRSENDALKYGTIENVWKSGDTVYAYSRNYNGESVVVVLNFNGQGATSTLNVPFQAGTLLKDELSGETFTVTAPTAFTISVPAYGSRILASTQTVPTPTATPTPIPGCGGQCGRSTCAPTEKCVYLFGIPLYCSADPTKCLVPTPIQTPTPVPTPTVTPPAPLTSLSDVKVSVVYERLNDARPKRTIDEQLQIFKETYTDLIFRASWRWNPQPNSCADVPSAQKQACIDTGYSFEDMKNTISATRKSASLTNF